VKVKCVTIKVIRRSLLKTYVSPETNVAPGDKKLKIYIDEGSCGTKNLSLGWIAIPPKSRTDEHTRQTDEVIYVLKGTATIVAEGQKYDLSEGDAIFIPPGVSHRHENNGSILVEQIWIFSPSGPEKALRNLPAEG
jgi:quercetin dioxygenase-like cupin family protein